MTHSKTLFTFAFVLFTLAAIVRLFGAWRGGPVDGGYGYGGMSGALVAGGLACCAAAVAFNG